MIENPFKDDSRLNQQLDLELCQEIHFRAMCSVAADQCEHDILPTRVTDLGLAQLMRVYGWEACLENSELVLSLFRGVTTKVFMTIQELYSDRIGRCIPIVFDILKAMAEQANVCAVGYEAIWAICVFLSMNNKRNSLPTLIATGEWWNIAANKIQTQIEDKDGKKFRPFIICVVNDTADQVLSFRIAENGLLDEAVRLALYDAVTNRRQPSQLGTGGMEWHLPSAIVSDPFWQEYVEPACRTLEIEWHCENGFHPTNERTLEAALNRNWSGDLRDRKLTIEHLELIFDNYLFRGCGFGPRRARDEKKRSLSHLVGYGRDPASQYPALRTLLPVNQGNIEDGAVFHDGLHYEHDLMKLWPDHHVCFRLSQESEARCWVYFNNEILCQAMARELRRLDGSYRPNRPGR